ncbi:MAG: LapA family protein [Hormoscilla sp.]
MPALNLVLLLAILGGLTLFAWQNWSPSLSLVFLGSPTPPLPLAVWILLLLAAGIMTGLSIAASFRWYSYLEARSLRRRPRYEAGSAYPAGSRDSQESQASETDYIPSSQTGYQADRGRESFPPRDDSSNFAAVANNGDRISSSAASNNDDWEQENKISDDWEEVVTSGSTDRVPRQSGGIEEKGDRAKADGGEKNDSFYSYGSQDKSNSGVGKTEDVYEANYRVITPPVHEESAGDKDEDWGLDEDER